MPKYFNSNVVPEIPTGGKVFDLGCGRGTLIQEIINRRENSEIVGIDIKQAPEWNKIVGDKVRMEVVQEENFLSVLEREQPDVVTVTWVFHHMEYEQQKRYIGSLYKALKTGAVIVALEDSYSETLPPEAGQKRYEDFMKWDKENRQKIMGVLDWIANRIFSMRLSMPVPFAYRTLEDWKQVFEEAGFETLKMRFLGFPDDRDINNPQSLLVIRKP
ncbi:MAG: class I SAM-dependent methyltransferase [Candidatus Zambryskibacteria bacterium]|nr:class I SAM-dependent methyltransferase [Candidatus Zambryskibacteria bacterium]